MSGDPWSPDHPLLGRVLQGRYQVASFVCEGGMAQVFCGVQEEEPRHVAIKVMHPELADDQEIVQRFLREAKIASRLKHPNIVRIVSVGEDRELLFIVMELLFGDDLSARVKQRGSFTEMRSVEIMADVFSALQFAHEHGVIHRDIKPENVMLCRDPKEPQRELVKVLDFGIAKILDELPSVQLPDEAPTGFRSVLTRVGGWVGTPGYMSPEQGSAERLDHRSDIYSAGCLLFELLTGRLPFEGQTPLQIIARHVREEPPKPSSFVPIHPELERLVMRLLEKKPDRRPSTARDVADELLLLLGDLSATSSQRWVHMSANEPVTRQAVAPPSAMQPRPSVQPSSYETPKIEDSTMRSSGAEPTSQSSLRELKRTLHLDRNEVLGAVSAAMRPPERPAHPLVGRYLSGKYQISALIRDGSVSQIFSAVSNQEPRYVALKVLHPEYGRDRDIVGRFVREGQAATRLTHPNIVRTLGASEDQGISYIAMELLFGDDLSARIKQRGAVPQNAAIAIVVQICKALEHAHKKGLVHRDIKPENIMVCRQPDNPTEEIVKVIDFGTAKIFDAKAQVAIPSDSTSVRSVLTRVGALVGTPTYMSPEQGRAEPVDLRSDLYSVGVLLYELLCGKTPFQGETPLQIVARHVHEAPPPPSKFASVPLEIERIVMRCLEKKPEHRPQSAIELAALLETALPNVVRSSGSGMADRWLKRTGAGMADPSMSAPVQRLGATTQSLPSQQALPSPPPRPPSVPPPVRPPSVPPAPAKPASLKQTIPMVSVKQTLPMAARPNVDAAIDRALQAAQGQAPVSGQRERVDKLIRLVTLLLVLLAVACVVIGLMLYYFVAKS